MLNLSKHIKLELLLPLTQFVRYKGSFSKNPRNLHFGAKLLNTVVKPTYPRQFDKFFPQHLKCRKILQSLSRREPEENPYERILANEIKDEVLKSKMLIIIHKNPMIRHFIRKYSAAFKREGMKLIVDSRITVSKALIDTKYAPILELFHSHTVLVASPEPDVYTAYSLLKKMPPFIVLAGVIEDKFVDYQTLEELSKLPDLNAARAQLAHTLNTPAMILAHNINLYGESHKPDSE